MMEPWSLDHQREQELHSSSNHLPSLPYHLPGSNHEQWTRNFISSASTIVQDNGVLSSSIKDFREAHENQQHTISMTQDLGFHWEGNTADAEINNSACSHAQTHQIKYEVSENHLNFFKQQQQSLDELSLQPDAVRDCLFNNSSSRGFGDGSACDRGNFSALLFSNYNFVPSLNLQPPTAYENSVQPDLQAFNFLAAARFGRTFSQPLLNTAAILRENLPYELDCHKELNQVPSDDNFKLPSTMDGVTGVKRCSNLVEHKLSQPQPKKPRFESRSSISPFKVRKEKLGDRIAALQQLVAPFGKTDTASVLMEAIGYIKFLQDQIETLSVPYMGPSSNKKLKRKQGEFGEEDEPKLDLRSRGLCLVPLSCTSYVTNENVGLWPSPSSFRGGT